MKHLITAIVVAAATLSIPATADEPAAPSCQIKTEAIYRHAVRWDKERPHRLYVGVMTGTRRTFFNPADGSFCGITQEAWDGAIVGQYVRMRNHSPIRVGQTYNAQG